LAERSHNSKNPGRTAIPPSYPTATATICRKEIDPDQEAVSYRTGLGKKNVVKLRVQKIFYEGAIKTEKRLAKIEDIWGEIQTTTSLAIMEGGEINW
jgi:hypothetical protein